MTRAEFDYLAFDGTPNTIYIRDLNRGQMSVTNDAEAVVDEVNRLFPGKRIVYRDSDGKWDELVHENGRFIRFDYYEGPRPD